MSPSSVGTDRLGSLLRRRGRCGSSEKVALEMGARGKPDLAATTRRSSTFALSAWQRPRCHAHELEHERLELDWDRGEHRGRGLSPCLSLTANENLIEI